MEINMKWMKFVNCSIIIVIIVIILICGCINDNTFNNNSMPSMKYSVLEEKIWDEGNITAGKLPFHGDAMPLPIFLYNKTRVHEFENKSIDYPPNYPPMNESMKILLGTYQIENIPWSLKGNLNVSGIYGYPYKLASGLEIINVDKNGTIYMLYDNNSINLKIGDVWVSPIISTRIETYNGSYIDSVYSYTVEYSRTITLTNRGMYDKTS
jgi:hypothetical protein